VICQLRVSDFGLLSTFGLRPSGLEVSFHRIRRGSGNITQARAGSAYFLE
jgi:hypothetical protein